MKRIILIALLVLVVAPFVSSRRNGYRFKAPAATVSKTIKPQKAILYDIAPDSVAVKKLFPDYTLLPCNDSTVNLKTLVFSGFDKKRNNSRESFFVINGTGMFIGGALISLEYATPDGRMLHRRYALITQPIPAGETRKIDIPSWDTQHSFYYLKSESDPSRGNPFDVKITPLLLMIEPATELSGH